MNKMFRRPGWSVGLSSWLLLGMLLGMPLAAAEHKTTADPSVSAARDPFPFSKLPETFIEQRPRNESAENRVALTTLLTKARLLEHRGDVGGSLQAYQRAYRLSPTSTQILQNVVRLAFMLKRNDVASRYAVLLAEQKEEMSADALQRLAQYCLENAQIDRAIPLYERAVAALETEGSHAQQLGVRFRLLGLYGDHDEHQQAARHARHVARMLSDPDKYQLEEVLEQFTEGGLRATYEQLGTTLLQADQVAEAEALLAKAREFEEIPGLDLLHAAQLAAARKDPADAQKKLMAYLDADFQTVGVQPYQLLLEVLQETSSSLAEAEQTAIELLLPAHQRSPAHAPLAFFLADLYARQSQWDQVILVAAPLVEKEATAEVLSNLCRAYIEQKEWSALVELLETALDERYELTRLASPLEELHKNEPAWDSFQKFITKRERATHPLRQRMAIARFLQQVGEGEDAWTWIESALPELDSQEKARLLLQFATQAFQDNQEFLAEQALRAGIRLELPKSQASLFYFYLTTVLEMQSKTSDALRTAKRAALLDEESALLRSRIPWTLYHSGQLDAAAEEYLNLLKQFADDYERGQTRQVIRDTKRILSNLAIQQGDIDQAVEWLQQVLDEFPDDTGVMNDLGYLWVDQGKNLGRGLDMIQKALHSDPENAAYLDSLGWAYFRLGRHAEAIEKLEKAVATAEKPDGTILDHLGEAYHAAGQMDKAREVWQKAVQTLEQQSDNDLLPKVQKKLQRVS